MRVNSVFGMVLSIDRSFHAVMCELFMGPLKTIVDLPYNKFTDKPYPGMPITMTIGHGETVVVLQIYKTDVAQFENMKAETEAALQALERENV